MTPMKILAFSVFLIIFLFYFGMEPAKKPNSTDKKTNEIKIYCAAGLKTPIEEAAKLFTKETGIEVTLTYGGSGQLQGSLHIYHDGDIFISADDQYIQIAKEKKLIKEVFPIANQYPVIITQKGNPKNITTLEDFAKSQIKLSLSNTKSASIGKLTKAIFEEKGIWEAVEKNTIDNGTFKPTVIENLGDIELKVMDASLAWSPLPKQAGYINDMDIIEVEELKKHQQTITVGVLTSSSKATNAIKFCRFLQSKEFGQRVFADFKYETLPIQEKWIEEPEIFLMSGGVNRMAIQKTLKLFEEREGVSINTVYNGCGILVGQMKAGDIPDAYFACDISFVNEVSEKFEKGENLSKTEIVLAILKSNPKNIQTLDDLKKDGIKIGVGHPEQSALGSLTAKVLKSMSLFDAIEKNIVSQVPTADTLVAQLVTKNLDACFVYQANLATQLDKVTTIALNHEKSKAIQPFVIAKNTKHHYIIERLKLFIKEHRDEFTKAGFEYIGQ